MLDALVAGAREDADARAAVHPLAELEHRARNARPVRPFNSTVTPSQTVGVIAEVKRASPSKGHLADIADPVALALEYEAGGAVAISVLTESRRFLGSLDDLEQVGNAVSVPVLRKDFLTTDYQIVEARAYGADIVLLILACLDDSTAASLMQLADSLGMAVLVETHSREEVERAVALRAPIIGVNARDLTTFEVDRDLFGRLAPLIPSDVLTIAESAVASVADVRHYREGGANCVLVGEALVTNGNPRETVKEFSHA